eukprot:5189584-Pyramimonas_sp.AAC.1
MTPVLSQPCAGLVRVTRAPRRFLQGETRKCACIASSVGSRPPEVSVSCGTPPWFLNAREL